MSKPKSSMFAFQSKLAKHSLKFQYSYRYCIRKADINGIRRASQWTWEVSPLLRGGQQTTSAPGLATTSQSVQLFGGSLCTSTSCGARLCESQGRSCGNIPTKRNKSTSQQGGACQVIGRQGDDEHATTMHLNRRIVCILHTSIGCGAVQLPKL